MRFVACFVCIVGILAGFSSQSTAQVLINEILADPAVDWDGDGAVSSKGDEWVEIVNTGAAAIDLSSYRLGDASGGYAWRYGFDGMLAPGTMAVVFGSDAVAWESANGFSTVGLSLNNGGDTVYLYNLGVSDTSVVDVYAYDGFAVQDDRSVGRFPDGGPSWNVFDALNPYTGDTPPLGNGCEPSPGVTNDCGGILPVEHSTWGAIKQMYEN